MSAARHPRKAWAVVLLALALTAVACGGGDGDEAGTGGGDGPPSEGGPDGGFPVEIEHKYGTTTVEAAPEQVVTVGLTDQDPALALGVVPVGITQWFDTHENGVGAWAEDLLGDARPELLDADAVNAEAIAALQPDLILALYSALTEQEYETLSQIAPVVAQPDEYVDYGIPWDEQTITIGRALGRADEAEALVADVEARMAAAREANPAFEGATAAVATPYQGTVSIFAPQDPRGRLLDQLGFQSIDGLEDLAGDQFAAEISDEQVDMLDVDALVWILNTVESDLAELHAQPVYGGLDVVAQGREVGVSNFEPLGEATSFQSVLSLPFLLDNLVPMLAEAVDGDPATAVQQPAG